MLIDIYDGCATCGHPMGRYNCCTYDCGEVGQIEINGPRSLLDLDVPQPSPSVPLALPGLSEASPPSQSTETERMTIVETVAKFLLEDDILQPLYDRGMKNPDIGPERFTNDFQRLLEIYGKNLLKEAENELDYRAVQYVVDGSMHIANLVRERYDPIYANSTRSPSTANRGHRIDDFELLRPFMLQSNAFDDLRKGVYNFIETHSPHPGVPSSSTIPNHKNFDDSSKDACGATAKANIPVRLVRYVVIDKFFSHLKRAMRPGVPTGYQRIEWTCVSGYSSLE